MVDIDYVPFMWTIIKSTSLCIAAFHRAIISQIDTFSLLNVNEFNMKQKAKIILCSAQSF